MITTWYNCLGAFFQNFGLELKQNKFRSDHNQVAPVWCTGGEKWSLPECIKSGFKTIYGTQGIIPENIFEVAIFVLELQ